jgi:hypothetical protein
VTDQHDPIDAWLERDVTPMMPRPGSLERIRRTARRRKRNRAMLAAAGCAVVIAAAATAPQIASALRAQPAGNRHPIAAGTTPPSAQPTASGSASGQSAGAKPLQTAQRTRLSTTTSGTAPPPHFRPTSVTFVGTGSNSVVGAVIGQAGPPCATSDCTSLAGTSDYGTTWYGVSAPEAPGPAGATGVSQLRFASMTNGWAFGPALWETSDGGWPWRQEDTYGLRVTDLEAAGQRAFAVFASCSGAGQDYASDCTSFSLYSSAAGSTTWMPVAVPAAFTHMTTSAASAATLVISGGTTGYLLTPSGEVLSGPVTGGAWSAVGQAPCRPGQAQASGQPASAQLAAGSSLVLACDTGDDPAAGESVIYTSADGTSWKQVAVLPTSGWATSLASTSTGQVALATTGGRYYSQDNGASWRAARVTSAPTGGFSYVGLTNAAQGVAVPEQAALGEIFVTRDGGRTWTPAPIAG